MTESVTLSEWEQASGSCMRQQRASGPSGEFVLTLFLSGDKVSHAWISNAEEVDAGGYCIATGKEVGKSLGEAEVAYVPLLLALAGQPTDAERRALDAVMGLGVVSIVELENLVAIRKARAPGGELEGQEHQARIEELLRARDTLKAERGKA